MVKIIELPSGEVSIPSKDDDSYFFNSKFVTELTPESFDKMKSNQLKKKMCCIVLFYAPWCPHCKELKDVWNKLGEVAAFYSVCAFNCEKYKDHCEKIRVQQSNFIEGYPTIAIYKKGVFITRYTGERTLEKLLKKCLQVCKVQR